MQGINYKIEWGYVPGGEFRKQCRMKLDYDDITDESFVFLATYGHTHELIRIMLSEKACEISQTARLNAYGIYRRTGYNLSSLLNIQLQGHNINETKNLLGLLGIKIINKKEMV